MRGMVHVLVCRLMSLVLTSFWEIVSTFGDWFAGVPCPTIAVPLYWVTAATRLKRRSKTNTSSRRGGSSSRSGSLRYYCVSFNISKQQW